MIKIIVLQDHNPYSLGMKKISSYAQEMTEDYPSPPKGFTETKDHYTGWFFKSLKSITSDKPS